MLICFFLLSPFLPESNLIRQSFQSGPDLHVPLRKTVSGSCMDACVVFACLDDIRFLEAGLPGCVLYQQIRREVEEFLCPFLQQVKVKDCGSKLSGTALSSE